MASLDQILDNTGGALAIGTFLVLRPFLHERYRRWGATDPEVYCTLPGDERVPHSLVTQTMAITINASPAQIWPWIAQIGQERGGLYSYDLLENIARCQMHNADHIVPEWELKPGDRVRLGPAGYPVHGVVGVEREHWLLLAGADLKTAKVEPLPTAGQTQFTNFSWVLFLATQPDGTTRLITRTRLDYAPHTLGLKVIWEWITDPIGFVMTRKMLLTVKERAESPQVTV